MAETPSLKSFAFRLEREESWRELEELIQRAGSKGIGALDADELHRLPVLYRATLSSLSVARAISLDRNVIDYLDSLAARAYVFVYGTKRQVGTTIVEYFTHRYPALVWSMRWWVLLAAALLCLGVVSGFLLTEADASRFHTLVPEWLAQGRSPLSTRQELLEVLRHGSPDGTDALGAFASFLFTHNARVGILCFVLGFAAGVPAALLVFSSGLGLGAFAAIHHQQGLTVEFWAWILPHGITELLAVCICAAAGFRVGMALLFPGPLLRLDALAQSGREAASVVVGTVALFLVAALLEGFFRQLVLNDVIRYAVAIASIGLLALYFRPRREEA